MWKETMTCQCALIRIMRTGRMSDLGQEKRKIKMTAMTKNLMIRFMNLEILRKLKHTMRP